MTTTIEPDLLDIEHRLICRVLTDPDDWLAVAAARITDEFFVNPKHLRVWQTIRAYQTEYQQLPTIAMLRQDFPRETYDFLRVHEPINYLIEELQRSRTAAILELGMQEMADAWQEGDYDAALRALDTTGAEAHRAVPIADDMDLTTTGDERLAWYMERANAGGDLLGIRTGYVSLDKATGGLQPEQLITLVGFAKHGKSDLLLDVARATHLEGERPLYIGFEMSNREQAERYDARRAGISLTRLRDGTLRDEEWDRLHRSINTLNGMHAFILSADRTSTMTLSGIAAKIDMIKPTVVFIDGAYMMDDQDGEPKNSPRALTNLTRGLKRLAQRTKLPIVITTQGLEGKDDRKKGLTRRSIGYSSSFIQDSDVVIGVERSEEDPDIQKLSVLAARNCPPLEFFIRRDWDKGMVEELDYNPFEADGPDREDDDVRY